MMGCSALMPTSSHYTPPDASRLALTLQNRTLKGGIRRPIALLIGADTEARHRNNISLAYQVLLEQGYKRQDIFILDSEGGNPAIYPISDTLSRKSMDMMFTWLLDNLDDSDTLLVYVTGHGNKDSLSLNKAEKISKPYFMMLLNSLSIYSGIVIFDQCYWGAPNIRSPYVFISASSNDRTSYDVTFPRTFWNAFRRLDSNVSVLEAFRYAKLHDRGYRLGHQIPEISYTRVNPAEINLLLTNPAK